MSEPALRVFRAYLDSGLGRRKPSTVRAWCYGLRHLPQPIPTEPERLDRRLGELEHLASETRFDIWRHWKRFYRWAVDRGLVQKNPMRKVEAPPRQRGDPRVFSRGEQLAIWNAATTARERALVAVSFCTAGRLSEISSMRWSQIHLGDSPHVDFSQGKSGRRRVPLDAGTAAVLKELREWQASERDKSLVNFVDLDIADRVWLSERSGEPLTPSGLAQVWEDVRLRANVFGERAGIHTSRHTAATSFASKGGTGHQLQVYLGHKQLSTTEVYVRLGQVDIQRDFEAMSPALILWDEPTASDEPVDSSEAESA